MGQASGRDALLAGFLGTVFGFGLGTYFGIWAAVIRDRDRYRERGQLGQSSGSPRWRKYVVTWHEDGRRRRIVVKAPSARHARHLSPWPLRARGSVRVAALQ